MNLSKLIDFAYGITEDGTGRPLSHNDIVRPPQHPLPPVSPGGHVKRLIHVDCPSGEQFFLDQEFYPLSTGDNPTQTVTLRHRATNREGSVLHCRIETIWDQKVLRRQSLLSIEIAPNDEGATVGGDYNLGGHRDNVGPIFTSNDLEAHAFMFQLATVLRAERLSFR